MTREAEPFLRPIADFAPAGRRPDATAFRSGPDLLASSFAALDAAVLRSLGKDALLLDVDGTLAGHGAWTPPAEAAAWVASLAASGIALAVVSNAGRRRMESFCAPLGVRAYPRAGKPSPRALRAAMAHLRTTPDRTAFLGDQLYTDVAAARRAGLLAILVRPIPGSEPWNVRLKRVLERARLRRLLGRDGLRGFLPRA